MVSLSNYQARNVGTNRRQVAQDSSDEHLRKIIERDQDLRAPASLLRRKSCAGVSPVCLCERLLHLVRLRGNHAITTSVFYKLKEDSKGSLARDAENGLMPDRTSKKASSNPSSSYMTSPLRRFSL